jgi:hypothetical protein
LDQEDPALGRQLGGSGPLGQELLNGKVYMQQYNWNRKSDIIIHFDRQEGTKG